MNSTDPGTNVTDEQKTDHPEESSGTVEKKRLTIEEEELIGGGIVMPADCGGACGFR